MICYFKLASGDELIGKVDAYGKNDIVVENPLRVQYMERGGQWMSNLTTFSAITDTIRLNPRFILFSGEATPDFVLAFEKATAPTSLDKGEQEEPTLEIATGTPTIH